MTKMSTAAHMTRIGHGFYLTPSDAAMSREHMAAWFRIRGVTDAGELDRELDEHAGRTEAEMDAMYASLHEGC